MMETSLLIGLVGLALALGAALVVMRRRADELDRTVAALESTRTAPPDAVPGPTRVTDATAPMRASRGGTIPAVALDDVDDLLLVGLVLVDQERRITFANTAAHGLLEIPAGRLVGRSVMEAFLDVRVETALDEVPPGGSSGAEARVGTGGGRIVAIRARRRDTGELVLVLEDETEVRRLRQMRTEFIDNLSHELRTPLSTVSLLAETAARDAAAPEVPEKLRERITRIEVETGHLVQMVNELLDLARIEGGTQLRLMDDIDLGALAAASADRLRLFAERQGVQLVVDAEPGLPNVQGDEARLGQVFVNLVHNAVKFSPDGGEVRVIVRRAGDLAEVAVRDQGVGISRADRARVFERFYKADRARVRGGGTGLGLAIARHVVEAHGGRIRVDSEEGRGSTFTFTIPFVQPVATAGVPQDA
jgi:two-component system phosphate regulon sensor histidine kinase PhoR